MRRHSRITLSTLALLSAAFAATANEQPADDARFAPLAFLVGHCWRGSFPDGSSDIQCYDRLYDGRFLRSTHHITGKDGGSYGGMTVFSWDGEQQRLRFHYFTSTGAVSEGHFAGGDDGILIPERHVEADGKVTELETRYTVIDAQAYRVSTRQQKAGDAVWSTLLDVVYRRTDAPDNSSPNAAVRTAAGDWQLVWSRSLDDGWRVVTQDATGAIAPITDLPGDAWAWATNGRELVLLSKHGDDENAKGWRPARWSTGDETPRFIGDERVGDCSIDCHPDGWPCALTLRIDGKRRLALIDANGHRALIGSGSSEDGDGTWSADGRQLLFRSNRSGSWELWLGDARGNNAHALTGDDANNDVALHSYGGEGPARFSPDGRHIVWTRSFPNMGFDVWIMDADGGNPRNLTANHAGSDAYPSVSPDGKWIAFGSDRSGDSEIHRMRLDGSDVQRISFHPGYEGAPMWWLAKPAAAD
ncbi:MAG: hypothetical protein R3F01_10395 [Lysobacteraceae bacterium]